MQSKKHIMLAYFLVDPGLTYPLEDFDINLLKDGLTFELFELNCTDYSSKRYTDNTKYTINIEY